MKSGLSSNLLIEGCGDGVLETGDFLVDAFYGGGTCGDKEFGCLSRSCGGDDFEFFSG